MNKWELAPVYLQLITDIGPSCCEVLTRVHCIIAENSKTLLNIVLSFPLTQTLTHKDIQTQEPVHNIFGRNHLSAHIRKPKFFLRWYYWHRNNTNFPAARRVRTEAKAGR